MIIHILLIFFSITAIEIIIFLNFFKKLDFCLLSIKKIIQIITDKRESDLQKEKNLLDQSKKLILNSFKILLIFSLIILIYFLISELNFSFSNYFLSMYGIIETIIVVIVYIFLRKFIYDKL